jgi:hypothetical protein
VNAALTFDSMPSRPSARASLNSSNYNALACVSRAKCASRVRSHLEHAVPVLTQQTVLLHHSYHRAHTAAIGLCMHTRSHRAHSRTPLVPGASLPSSLSSSSSSSSSPAPPPPPPPAAAALLAARSGRERRGPKTGKYSYVRTALSDAHTVLITPTSTSDRLSHETRCRVRACSSLANRATAIARAHSQRSPTCVDEHSHLRAVEFLPNHDGNEIYETPW